MKFNLKNSYSIEKINSNHEDENIIQEIWNSGFYDVKCTNNNPKKKFI